MIHTLRIQVTTLRTHKTRHHRGDEVESISNFFNGNQLHATLRILSPEICKESLRKAKASQLKTNINKSKEKLRQLKIGKLRLSQTIPFTETRKLHRFLSKATNPH